ncbi:MAG: HEAT repeat domain-containing protein [Fusobacteriaceae bacterium]|nr:HEAT repeat domain-containing protein [Fusobacteriaceae bacterium]
MLEIIVLILVCRKNIANARSRGQGKGLVIFYTLALWFGAEIIGAFIGAFLGLSMLGVYFTAIVAAAIGGVVSNAVSKSGPVFEDKEIYSHGIQLAPVVRKVFIRFANEDFDANRNDWESPVKSEFNELLRGGNESIRIIEEFLLQCADGQGLDISEHWWEGSRCLIKILGRLPQREATKTLVRILSKDSALTEWFTYTQLEAVGELGDIGLAENVPALRRILNEPFQNSPTEEIELLINKINSRG